MLLTDARRLDDERFAVAASWHRDHYLAHHGGSAADPVLLVETARQAAIHLSHRFLDVPHGMPFVLSTISVDLVEALPPVGTDRLAVGLDAVCRSPAQGERRLRLELEADVLVQHTSVGRVRVRWEPMEPRRYTMLRRRGEQAPEAVRPPALPPAVPLPPFRVGQCAERDVLLAAEPLRGDGWWLRLDREHPVLFDHESDHVPGMALVEAFRQAGQVTVGDSRPVANAVTLLDVRFTAFGELHLPVWITAEPAGPDGNVLTVRARQGDRDLAHATLRRGAAESALPRLDTAC
ncbi:lactone biosynthesis protein, mmfl [Streptomyces actuosus]|uniref:Lactone biosynthesis protein, mmfl n=1 Tax=Streptomyces actuosus TaxID=1885 RepID=A0ABS2VVL0_STRAS|nr:lactone biosynthesis protein, mmfl [Streptomyces actuosus]